MILEIFVRSKVRLFVVNEAGGRKSSYALPSCLAAPLVGAFVVTGGQRLEKSYPALVICVGTSRRWFPLCFQTLHSTIGCCQ